MRKMLPFVGAALVMTVLLGAYQFLGAKEDNEKEPKYTIKEVMKQAHKSDPSLRTKVVDGEGTKADKKKLLSLYMALAENKPEKGSLADWKKRTKAIVVAAKAVVADKEGADARLKMATNCAACHKLHRQQ
jgi:hypothetical protein